MRHIGHEPPWEGFVRNGNYELVWIRGEELWDDSGYEWHLRFSRAPSIFEQLLRRLPSGPVAWLDEMLYGFSVSKDGKRIDPKEITPCADSSPSSPPQP